MERSKDSMISTLMRDAALRVPISYAICSIISLGLIALKAYSPRYIPSKLYYIALSILAATTHATPLVFMPFFSPWHSVILSTITSCCTEYYHYFSLVTSVNSILPPRIPLAILAPIIFTKLANSVNATAYLMIHDDSKPPSESASSQDTLTLRSFWLTSTLFFILRSIQIWNFLANQVRSESSSKRVENTRNMDHLCQMATFNFGFLILFLSALYQILLPLDHSGLSFVLFSFLSGFYIDLSGFLWSSLIFDAV